MSKPLTIDELKALQVCDWVWVVKENKKGRYYAKALNDDIEFIPVGFYSLNLRYSLYGIEWIAYKNKEQAENTQMTNAEKQMILYLINAGGADLCQKCIHLNKPTCGRYISPTDYSGECSDDYCIDGMLQYFERESDIK